MSEQQGGARTAPGIRQQIRQLAKESCGQPSDREWAEQFGRQVADLVLRAAERQVREQKMATLRDERWDAGWNRATEVCSNALSALRASLASSEGSVKP